MTLPNILVRGRGAHEPHANRTLRSGLALVLVLAGLAAALTGCSGARSPEAAVERILELRSRNCTSTAAYAPYVSSSLAGQFAEDSAKRDPVVSPIPKWGAIVRAQENTSSVEVGVEWVPSDNYPNWPVATIFVLEKFNGQWMLVDAYNSDETNPASKQATSTP